MSIRYQLPRLKNEISDRVKVILTSSSTVLVIDIESRYPLRRHVFLTDQPFGVIGLHPLVVALPPYTMEFAPLDKFEFAMKL